VIVRLVDSGWETELRRGLAVADGRLLIACPFIKQSVIARLLNVTRLDEILVVTRFNLSDFARGVSDIAALQTLMEAGAEIRGMRGLHAKVFVFGNRRAAVTSANLTEAGLRGNIEFGCVSDETPFIAACTVWVEQLHADAASTTEQELQE
jgi:phosphatidylserine/phosphatidylglycerophosphate/cardiolipin synthase-like enzyme